MNIYHKSVLLQEIIDLLNVKRGGKYIDATLGGGGHSLAILEKDGKVLGMDVDDDALDYVRGKIDDADNFRAVKANFRDIKKISKENGFGKVDGIIFDIGVSSHQIDTAGRGFSYREDGPLDMRMDRELNIKAADLVNVLTKGELYELFFKLGEETKAYAIAGDIVRSRRIKRIETTSELAGIIARSFRDFGRRQDAEARVFQALRIAVNSELDSLSVALPDAYDLVNGNGVIAVISFHSLEDRIVKNEFAKWEEENKGIILTKKPVTASEDEIQENSRSRSAKLRAFRKKI